LAILKDYISDYNTHHIDINRIVHSYFIYPFVSLTSIW